MQQCAARNAVKKKETCTRAAASCSITTHVYEYANTYVAVFHQTCSKQNKETCTRAAATCTTEMPASSRSLSLICALSTHMYEYEDTYLC